MARGPCDGVGDGRLTYIVHGIQDALSRFGQCLSCGKCLVRSGTWAGGAWETLRAFVLGLVGWSNTHGRQLMVD